MSFYLLFAPLSPILMLVIARRINGMSHVIFAFFAFCTFAPVAIVSTIVRNQFAISRVSFIAHAARFLFSDYLIQILFLMLVLVIFLNTRMHEFVMLDPANAILVFCCCYFFCEALYRLLFIPVPANLYERFIFPTIRLVLIMTIHMIMTRFHHGKHLITPFGYAIVMAIGAAILSTLIWFKFFVIGLLILITLVVTTIWRFTRAANAA